MLTARKKWVCVVLCVLSCVASASEHELWADRRLEPGVEDRLQVQYLSTFRPVTALRFRLLAEGSTMEQNGLSLIGTEATAIIKSLRTELTLAFQREYWSDWQVAENRAEAFIIVLPVSRLALLLGLCYRTPSYNVPSFFLNWVWPFDNSEWGIFYNATLTLINGKRFATDLLVGNYQRMRVYANDNIQIGLQSEWRMTEHWRLVNFLGIGVKGFSGAVVSFSQAHIGFGIRYAK